MTNFIQKFIFKQKMLWHIPINWRWALTRNMGYKKWRVLIDNLACFLQAEEGYHPKGKKIFAAFKATPFNKVRVVIIGQDPYPCKRNATGLAFSSPIERPLTKARSVGNIYRSITSDLGGEMPTHGNLDHWAEQGVFLLNRVLTLLNNENGNNTHNREEWRDFTQAVVQTLTKSNRPIQFILWGNEAEKIDLRDYPDCLIRISYHPISNRQGNKNFRNYRHFSKINTTLKAIGEKPIKWLP